MKNLTKLIFTIFILSGGFMLNAQEFITSVGANYDISKRWSIEGEVQNRNNSVSEINTRSWIFQGEIGYDILDHVNLSATYRNTSTETINHFAESDIEKNDKNRYTANIRYKTKRLANQIRFSHRLRYQYSQHDNKDDKEYIRYKLTIDHKLSKNAKPYVAIEPYYYLNKNKLKYFRLYLGNEFDFNRTNVDIFLITETEPENESFSLLYMLGVKLNFSLSH